MADQHGGIRVPGELQANTLDQLRAMLPAGLTHHDRTDVMSPEVLETWDWVLRVIPLSVRLAAFHESQRDWHGEMARKHGDHGHERAEQDRVEAAAAHEAAMAAPLNERFACAARRASGLADEASQKVGVRPFRPWPRR